MEKQPSEDIRRKEAEAIYGSDEELGEETGKDWEELLGEADTYTITRLAGGIRDPNRVNVFLDGQFAFSLDVAQVVDLNVRVKQKVGPDRLKELQAASEFGKLYQRTLEWALTRPHSVRETENYLKRKKFRRIILNKQRAKEEKLPLPELKDEVMALVVERLVEKGYVDNAKFAKFYVENRHLKKGISRRRMEMELRQKGINDADIEKALGDNSRPEAEEMRKMIKKKRAKYDDFKLIGYLARQGFEFAKAKEAVENYREDGEDGEDGAEF